MPNFGRHGRTGRMGAIWLSERRCQEMESVRHRRAIICAALAVILIAGLLYRVARWKENDTLTIQESGENLAESSEHSRDD